MGVKYGREYDHIIQEMVGALEKIEGLNEFFDMSIDDWDALDSRSKRECIHTVSDDVNYALGHQSTVSVGKGYVEYDNRRHLFKVFDGSKVSIINLI